MRGTPAEGSVVVEVVDVVVVVGPVGGELVVVGEGEGKSVGTGQQELLPLVF